MVTLPADFRHFEEGIFEVVRKFLDAVLCLADDTYPTNLISTRLRRFRAESDVCDDSGKRKKAVVDRAIRTGLVWFAH
jgi:hypothetical protein